VRDIFERLKLAQLQFEKVLEELSLHVEDNGDDFSRLPEEVQEMAKRTRDAIEGLAQPLEIFSEVIHQLEELQERPIEGE
jgi:hypothetical protein